MDSTVNYKIQKYSTRLRNTKEEAKKRVYQQKLAFYQGSGQTGGVGGEGLADRINDLAVRKEGIIGQLTTAIAEVQKLKKQIDVLLAGKKQQEDELEKLRALVEGKEKAVSNLTKFSDDAKAKQAKKELDDLIKRIKELEDELNDIKEENEKLLRIIAEHEKEIDGLQQALKTCEKEKVEIKGELKTARENVTRLTEELKVKANELKEANEANEEYEKIGEALGAFEENFDILQGTVDELGEAISGTKRTFTSTSVGKKEEKTGQLTSNDAKHIIVQIDDEDDDGEGKGGEDYK